MPPKQNFRFWCLKSKLSSLDASKMNFPLRHLKKPLREETSSPRHPMGEGVFSGLIGIYLFRHLLGIQGKKFTLEAFMEGKADFLTSLLLLLFRICFWGIQGGQFNYEASREESMLHGDHFLFEAFREGKLVLKHHSRGSLFISLRNSVFKHPRRRILLRDLKSLI